MEVASLSRSFLVVIAMVLAAAVLPAGCTAHSQTFAPAPSPASDGTTIDQGIAYILMLVALVLTYIIH